MRRRISTGTYPDRNGSRQPHYIRAVDPNFRFVTTIRNLLRLVSQGGGMVPEEPRRNPAEERQAVAASESGSTVRHCCSTREHPRGGHPINGYGNGVRLHSRTSQ